MNGGSQLGVPLSLAENFVGQRRGVAVGDPLVDPVVHDAQAVERTVDVTQDQAVFGLRPQGAQAQAQLDQTDTELSRLRVTAPVVRQGN